MKQRNTRQKQLVLEAVQGRSDHPSADEIYFDVREQDDKISKGTVYRNLKTLRENGEISEVKLFSADRFDYRLDPHYHLICTECGKVFDLPIPYKIQPDEHLAEETGFLVHRHWLLFEGICPACQKKTEKDRAKDR